MVFFISPGFWNFDSISEFNTANFVFISEYNGNDCELSQRIMGFFIRQGFKNFDSISEFNTGNLAFIFEFNGNDYGLLQRKCELPSVIPIHLHHVALSNVNSYN